MYTNNFGKMDATSAIKVANHFAKVGTCTPSTASDIDVSGQFMTSLVNRGFAKVVGLKESFIEAEGFNGLYRRCVARQYVLTVTASDFWNVYSNCVKAECHTSKQQAERYVYLAKNKLTEVENLLNKIDPVRV